MPPDVPRTKGVGGTYASVYKCSASLYLPDLKCSFPRSFKDMMKSESNVADCLHKKPNDGRIEEKSGLGDFKGATGTGSGTADGGCNFGIGWPDYV